MTTIVSNGYYMIADKRTTFSSAPAKTPCLKSQVKGFSYKRVPGRARMDGATKLIPEPIATYNGKKILSIAGSGSVSAIIEVMNLLTYLKLEDLISFKARQGGCGGQVKVILITEDFYSHIVDFTQHHAHRPSEKSYKPGTLAAVGSGGAFLMDIQERLNNQLNKVDILNAFLFASNSDIASSNCYDVYGTREQKYFSNVVPSHEEVATRANKAWSQLNFGKFRKQHHFPSDN